MRESRSQLSETAEQRPINTQEYVDTRVLTASFVKTCRYQGAYCILCRTVDIEVLTASFVGTVDIGVLAASFVVTEENHLNETHPKGSDCRMLHLLSESTCSKQKRNMVVAEETSQWIEETIALPEGLSSFPSTHTRQPLTLAPGDLTPPGLCRHLHSYAHRHTQICT